jgi:hypothetical protein
MFNPDTLPPKIKYWRDTVLASFDPATGYYYHTSDKTYDGFIDMLAWVGWMACGCKYMDDQELMDKCLRCVNIILTVGKDARTFAPYQVDTDWKQSTAITGLWYKEKAQSFAGPSAWYKMHKLGIPVADPVGNTFDMSSVEREAKWIALGAPAFGYMAKWFSGLRQHINSTWLALEVLEKKAPSSMEWTKYDNPFFMAINGEPYTDLDAMPQMLIKWSDATEQDTNTLQPLSKGGASDWIWRRDPYVKHEKPENSRVVKVYTPTALLVASYFQLGRTLK